MFVCTDLRIQGRQVTMQQLQEFSDANADEFADFIRERHGDDIYERTRPDNPAEDQDYIDFADSFAEDFAEWWREHYGSDQSASKSAATTD
eukprot:SAG11_NODE_4717_length_1794_cov_3.004130_3_plen_91_part_00